MKNDEKIQTALHWAKKTLQEKTETYQLDAEILLAYVLKLTRTQLLAHNEQKLTTQQTDCFRQLILQRALGIPVAYLVEEQEFWSLPLRVTKDTLIPRPETEHLVELALQLFSSKQTIRAVDLGTGSGAIALALASERPHWNIVATDYFSSTLAVAQQNADRLQITNIEFRLGDWCDVFLKDEFFDVIISNPPYLSNSDFHAYPKLNFEPFTALIANEQGLSHFQRITAQAKLHLRSQCWLLVEHGYNQATEVKALFQQHHYENIIQYRDLSGILRVTLGRRN